jgi:putative toxin-antitoxin system antitoxin component (TIGR02293 family)
MAQEVRAMPRTRRPHDRDRPRDGLAEDAVDFVHDEIVRGIPARHVKQLVESGALEAKRLFHIIPERTFNRRVANGDALKAHEADAVGRLLRVNREAARVFNDAEFARRWMSLPNPALGYRIPDELAETDAGAREVEVILSRIAYGDFS